MAGTADPLAAWIDASGAGNEAYIKRLALTDATVATMPSGDLRKALKALRRVKALAEQWYGERGNDYSASALFASKLREVLSEELLGEEGSDA